MATSPSGRMFKFAAIVVFALAAVAVVTIVLRLRTTHVEVEQLDFERIRLKTTRSGAPAPRTEIVVAIDAVELKATTDDAGVAVFRLPGSPGSGDLRAHAWLGPETALRLAVAKRTTDPRCIAKAGSYVSLELRCSVAQLQQVWPPMPERYRVVNEQALTGAVDVGVGPLHRHTEMTNGIGSLRFDANAAHAFIRAARLVIRYGDRSQSVPVDLPPLDDVVQVIATRYDDATAQVAVQNRTLSRSEARVRAGFRERGGWADCVLGCYSDEIVVLDPGETRSTVIRYHHPLDFPFNSSAYRDHAEVIEVVKRPLD